MRPQYDWGLAMAKGFKAAYRAGTAGGLVGGAITRQWALSAGLSLCSAFLGGFLADLDGFIDERQAWDNENRKHEINPSSP